MSLSALAAVNYSIIHSSFVFIAILVLFAHELGHYFMAKKKERILLCPFSCRYLL
jgi:hypothetical protein